MTAAAPVTFPGGRVVAGWWRQLAPHRPRNLWIAYLLLQRVEVLVRTGVFVALDPLLYPVLQVIAARGPLGVTELDRHVHLGGPLTWQVTRLLQAQGLIARQADGAWILTERERTTNRQPEYSQVRLERRSFSFLESLPTGAAPHFIRLQSRPRLPWPAGDELHFDLARLEDCLRQSDNWKARHGFPAEVRDIVRPTTASRDPETGAETIPEWQRTVIVNAERLPVALTLISAKDGREACHAFEFQQQGWHLQAAEPAFTLGEDWREVLPGLTEQVPLTSWRHAWQAWLQSRGVTDVDVASCRLERSNSQLLIRASHAVVERFRSVIRPAVQGDIWLLAGDGWFREALHVDLALSPSLA